MVFVKVVGDDGCVFGDVLTGVVVIEAVVGGGGFVEELWIGVVTSKVVVEDCGVVGEVWRGVVFGDVFPGWFVEDGGSVGVDGCVCGLVVSKFDAVVVAASVDVITISVVVVDMTVDEELV